MSDRKLARLIPAIAAADGAGVKLRRSLGATQNLRLDPFLMLDEFFTDDPDDYLAGFPSHPHRGFETVTYMLDGHMQHQDHLGNTGDLGPGDVQWMRAARGIIHSEMPQQQDGRMRGFQLWLNLPAAEKMQPASYRDIRADQIPEVALTGGGRVRVIAGQFQDLEAGTRTAGTVDSGSTAAIYLDLQLAPDSSVHLGLPEQHNALVYSYDGQMMLAEQQLPLHAAALLSPGASIRLQAGPTGGRALLLAGKPLDEPIVQYGPFVMNSREEIEQALRDYRDGTLAA